MIGASILLTVAVLLLLGFWSARRVRGSAGNFTLAGRTLTAPIVAILLMSQVIDSNATVGAADLSGGFGFWAGAAMPIGLAVSMLMLGLFVAKKVRAMSLSSLPSYFLQRFGRPGELLCSALAIICFGVLMAGNLVALGLLMEYFAGVPYWLSVIIVAGVALVYTLVGGMFASVYTGVFLMGVMTVGFVGLSLWMFVGPGYSAPEGLGVLDFEQLTQSSAGAVVNWATIFALGLGNLVAIDVFQRVSSSRSPGGARAAGIMAAVGTVVLCVPLAAVAVTGAGLLGDFDGPLLFGLLTGPVPQPIAITVIAALVAASLTTVSGIFLASSSIIVTNIFTGARATAMISRAGLLSASRYAMVPVAVIGIIVALRVNHTGILLTLAFDLLCASLVAPFLFSLWTRIASTRALMISTVLGLGLRMVLFVLTPTIYGVENTLLYLPNDVIGVEMDGWSTFMAAAVSAIAYLAIGMTDRPRHQVGLPAATAMPVQSPEAAAAPVASPAPAPATEPMPEPVSASTSSG